MYLLERFSNSTGSLLFFVLIIDLHLHLTKFILENYQNSKFWKKNNIETLKFFTIITYMHIIHTHII